MMDITRLESRGSPQGRAYSVAVAGSCSVKAGWQLTTETAQQLIYYCSVFVINYSDPFLLH